MNKNLVRYKAITGFILFLVAIFMALLFYRVVNAETTDQYYSDSIRLDGTVDPESVMFSWTPSMLPGYQIDYSWHPECQGTVRVGTQDYFCATLLYYEPGNSSYYFVGYINPLLACGKENVRLQPFLAVYNPVSGAHDVIYGNGEYVSFLDCKSVELPIIRK